MDSEEYKNLEYLSKKMGINKTELLNKLILEKIKEFKNGKNNNRKL